MSNDKPSESMEELTRPTKDVVDVVIKVHVKSGLNAVTDHASYFAAELGKLLVEHTGREALGQEIIAALALPKDTAIRVTAVPVMDTPLGAGVHLGDVTPAGNA